MRFVFIKCKNGGMFRVGADCFVFQEYYGGVGVVFRDRCYAINEGSDYLDAKNPQKAVADDIERLTQLVLLRNSGTTPGDSIIKLSDWMRPFEKWESMTSASA